MRNLKKITKMKKKRNKMNRSPLRKLMSSKRPPRIRKREETIEGNGRLYKKGVYNKLYSDKV
jgi:hypothetical protein